jgi:hypothetical protein
MTMHDHSRWSTLLLHNQLNTRGLRGTAPGSSGDRNGRSACRCSRIARHFATAPATAYKGKAQSAGNRQQSHGLQHQCIEHLLGAGRRAVAFERTNATVLPK